MITKKEIEELGLNPEYIKILGEAIAKEGRKGAMDFSYILEKTGKIERFIRDVEKDMRRREEEQGDMEREDYDGFLNIQRAIKTGGSYHVD